MEQLKDNIPLSEDTEQEPVEYGPGNPFLDYFKVMTSDFRSPGQVFFLGGSRMDGSIRAGKWSQWSD